MRTLVGIAVLLIAGAVRGAEPQADPPLSARASERKQDVEFLAEELPKLHIRPFEKVSKAAWIRTATQLGVEAENLAPIDYYLRLSQLVAMLQDSHTRVGKAPGITFHGYPFAVAKFKEGLVVVAIDAAHASLLGARLSKIGETRIEDAETRLGTLFPYENRASLMNGMCAMVTQAEALVFLSLQPAIEHAAFTLTDREGVDHVVTFEPVMSAKARPEIARLPSAPASEWAVSYRRDRNYWFKALPEKKAVFIKYDVCADDPERPFDAFVKDIEKALDEAKAERIVVDLRSNGGGNSEVMKPLTELIRARQEFKPRGSVVALIGSRTFSSAQLNARELQQECDAILVGTPTGQKPNAFGEVRHFKLPSSGIEIQYSTKEFRTAPSGTDPESMMPDITVEASVEDFAAGRDPALEAALGLKLGE